MTKSSKEVYTSAKIAELEKRLKKLEYMIPIIYDCLTEGEKNDRVNSISHRGY